MNEERKYIYSIIKNPIGTQASGASRLPEALFGINNREILLVPYRDMAAAVSNTPLINFDKSDKKELTQFIAVHDKVNAGLTKRHDVIPMRFGMIAENSEEIRRILTKAYIQFKTALEKIAGKAEFIVQVFWNENNMLGKIVRENVEIQQLKKSVESKGRISGLSSKIKLGKRICEALESCRKEYSADILGSLAAYFPDFSAGKLMDNAKERSSIEMGKEIIMNYSFLVGKAEEHLLELELNKLAEKYKDELRLKYIGPMAPYSFAVINLGIGNFDLVDNARRVLGLGESVAVPEIRDAYHKLAQGYHPDKHEYKKDPSLLEEAEKKMKDIITANEVLTVYCRHYLSALSPDEEQICSFRQEDVEDSIIIKEK